MAMQKMLSMLGLIVALVCAIRLVANDNPNANDDFAVKIVNNTGVKKVYVLVKGLNPNTKKPTFIEFDIDHPKSVGTYADVAQPDADIDHPTQSLNYGYDYTKFGTTEDGYIMHLPYLESGRIYISIGEKLKMPVVGKSPTLGIADPSPFNKSDPNYNYLYDKVEFTYLKNGETYINPTAVDCLALPIAVAQKRKVGNEEIDVLYGISYGKNGSREKTFKDIEKILTSDDASPEWKRLIIRDNNNNILRIVAPGRDDAFFDPKYLNEYIDFLWKYYETHPHTLTIDCREVKGILDQQKKGLEDYIFTGQVNNDVFEFKNKAHTYTAKIHKPESKNFFLAAQGPFEAMNGTPEAVIVRQLCSAWSVGLLPLPDNDTTQTILNKDYFTDQKEKGNFYKDNLLTQGLTNKPSYNLYAKAIHKISKDIYAWAYDDAIGLDGTNASTDKYPATLTIGRLKP